MRYKKHFTFYANAPVDSTGVDVAANRSVFTTALNGLSVFDMGRDSGYSADAQKWANFNFSPLQRAFYAPFPQDLNADAINYMRVDFYDANSEGTLFEPTHTYFFFVDDVKPVDEGDSTESDALTYLSITLDPWATNVLYASTRFFGGTLTGASVINSNVFPHTANPYNTPANLPFDTKTPFGEEIRGRVFDDDLFCAVVQVTGKDLGKVLLCCSTALTLNAAIKIAQAIANDVRMGYQYDGAAVKIFEAGELKVQGAFVVPASLCPWRDEDDIVEHGGAIYPVTGGGLEPAPWVVAEIETPDEKVVLSKAEEAYFDATGYYMDEGDYIPNVRVNVGTAFNRVDITEYFARKPVRGYVDTPPDVKIRALWGVNSFNVFMVVSGTTERDITSDFQVFAVVDPENDYIRQNKTNAILSTLGSVGSIAGGIAAIASGAGAGVGIGMIAGGATGIIRTANDFAVAANAPDVITSGGYGDVTNARGGVYYEFLNVPAWRDAIALNGIKRNLPITGEFFLKVNKNDVFGVDVNAVAIDGAHIAGIPAGDAEGIATMLRRGVRLWYDAMAWAERAV